MPQAMRAWSHKFGLLPPIDGLPTLRCLSHIARIQILSEAFFEKKSAKRLNWV